MALFYGVIKALNTLEKENVIKVRRVSGASAGAIAAALFAGRANIDALIEYHRNLGNSGEILSAFPDISNDGPLSKLFSLGKVGVANKPLGDEKAFSEIVENSLLKAGVTAKTIGELDIPCFINCTDIVEHKSLVSPPEQSLVQSIVDSAAIPFLFRVGGQKIDGGILDNLPVVMLGPNKEIQSELGVVLGVSFEPDRYTSPVDKSTELAKRLLETVMNERVAKSKELLGGENFLELETTYDKLTLSTFSVQNYLEVLDKPTILSLVEAKTMEWFKSIAGRETDAYKKASTSLSLATNTISTLAELRDFADTAYKSLDCELVSTSFEVTARCLNGGENELDEIQFIDVFKATRTPVHSYVARLSLDNDTLPMDTEIKISDGNGTFLDSSQFLIPDTIKRHFWVLVLLHNPIAPSEDGAMYRVHSKQLQKNAMGALRDNGHDYLSLEVTQSEKAGDAEIRLFVPNNCNIDILNGDWELINSLDIICPDDKEESLVRGESKDVSVSDVERCPAGYKPLVWRANNLKKGEVLRAIYKTAKSKR